MSEAYERVAMPMADGGCNFPGLAGIILQFAVDASPGLKHYIQTNTDGEGSLFRMKYDGQGGLEVTRGSVSTRFGASLFMELQRQGEGIVHVGLMDLEASRAYGGLT